MILKQIGDNADFTSLYSAPTTTTNNNNNFNNNNNNATVENESDSDNELLPITTIIPDPDEIDCRDEILDLLSEQNLVLTQSAEYKRKHFSNTSSESSDSDDSITRGLDFKNIPVTATIEPHSSPSSSSSAHTLLTNIQHTIARNIMENILTSQPVEKPKSSQKKVYDSEEDSDFEILDSEEIPK